jgi:hypothetical protein
MSAIIGSKSDIVLTILAIHRLLTNGQEYHAEDNTKDFLSDLSDDALMAILSGYTWDLYLKVDRPDNGDFIDALYEESIS